VNFARIRTVGSCMASQGGRKRKADQYEKECKDEFCSQMTGIAAIKFVSSLVESKLTIKQFLNLRANKMEMLPTFLLLEVRSPEL
jgi:hypothetical protein